MFMKTLKTSVVIGAVVLAMSGIQSTNVEAKNKSIDKSDLDKGTVTASVLNVRSGGSMKNKVIDQVIEGDQVNILSYSNGWYEIEYLGNTGWSYGKYISTPNSEDYSSNDYYLEETIEEESYDSSNALSFTATAYSGDTITSTGTVPRYGTIAVDPSVIPYGSKVYIHELGEVFTAEDCGGAIKGNKIDIYMNSESECYNWGRRNVTLEIVE